ncbi:hypothetical protein L327_0121990 [Yersinia pestis S3]|nr:hypothetical protein L327_0121990 [Yersinia pestis S3]
MVVMAPTYATAISAYQTATGKTDQQWQQIGNHRANQFG